jgi:hypothetical protein
VYCYPERCQVYTCGRGMRCRPAYARCRVQWEVPSTSLRAFAQGRLSAGAGGSEKRIPPVSLRSRVGMTRVLGGPGGYRKPFGFAQGRLFDCASFASLRRASLRMTVLISVKLRVGFPDAPVRWLGVRGSFGCGTAPLSRSSSFAQDDISMR